jgi:hypothetical protein
MDTRLYFLKEPIVLIGILLLGTVYYFARNAVEGKTEITETQETEITETDKTETQQETETDYKTDTTEWRKLYYEHLYWSK